MFLESCSDTVTRSTSCWASLDSFALRRQTGNVDSHSLEKLLLSWCHVVMGRRSFYLGRVQVGKVANVANVARQAS